MKNWSSHKVGLSAIHGIVKAEHVVQTQKESPQRQLAAQTGVQELHEKCTLPRGVKCIGIDMGTSRAQGFRKLRPFAMYEVALLKYFQLAQKTTTLMTPSEPITTR